MGRESLKCEECNWRVSSRDRRWVLKAGFFHIITRGHDVERQNEIEEEFNL